MRFFVLALLLVCSPAWSLICPQYLAKVSRAYWAIEAFDSSEKLSRVLTRDDLWEELIRLFSGEAETELSDLVTMVNQIPALERSATLDRIVEKLIVHNHEFQEQLAVTDSVLPRDAEVLDLGCGGGNFCSYLAYRQQGRRFILVDRDPVALELARRKMNYLRPEPRDRFMLRSVETLSLPPRSVDAILLNHFLIYLPDDRKWPILSASLRLVRPGGVVVAHEPIPVNRYYRDPEEGLMRDFLPTVLAQRAVFGDVATTFARVTRRIDTSDFPKLDEDTYPTNPVRLLQEARAVGLELDETLTRMTSTYFRLVFRVPE